LKFKLGEPIGLRSLLSAPQAPSSVDLKVNAKGKHVAFALDTLDLCDDAETIASITITGADGKVLHTQPIQYGRQVRSAEDSGMSAYADRVEGLSIYELQLPASTDIRKIRFEALTSRGGLRAHGVVVW